MLRFEQPRRRWALVVLLFVLWTIGTAQVRTDELRGLIRDDPLRIGILVERQGEAALALGLTQERLQGALRSRLMQAGLEVVPIGELPDRAYLYLNATVVPGAIQVSLALNRGVDFIARGYQWPYVASVWDREFLSALPAHGRAEREALLQVVAHLTDVFLEEYEAANRNPR